MQETSELEFLRRLACPVVILACRLADGRQKAMVATLSYVAIEPALVSFPVAQSSTTGSTIITNGACTASILGRRHLDSSLADTASMLDENLRVADAIAWADLKVCEVVQVAASAGVSLVIARVQDSCSSIKDDSNLDMPAIRYNRQYASLSIQTGNRQSDDRYPI